jgi:hypothetical protein
LLTIVVDMLSRLAAAENPPLSTTRANTVKLVNRSISSPNYRSLVDDGDRLTMAEKPPLANCRGAGDERRPDGGNFVKNPAVSSNTATAPIGRIL